MDTEIIIIDKEREIIERYKDNVQAAYITDISDGDTLEKVIPQNIDCVILDLPSNLEVSIIVTNNLKKMGIKNIIVKSDSDKHGEILKLVGATQIVYPDLEAARRVIPLLVSDNLYNFMPISSGLVMAEIFLPKKYAGKTLIESNIRYKEGVNIVAIKKDHESEYSFFVPDYKLGAEDILLAVGEEDNIKKFTSANADKNTKNITTIMKRLLGNN
jgi:trk system potassium uptake protein TrkA